MIGDITDEGIDIIEVVYKHANGTDKIGIEISGLMLFFPDEDNEGLMKRVDNLCKSGALQKKPGVAPGTCDFVYLLNL